MKTTLHSVYDQPDTASVHAQYDRVLDTLMEKLPKVAEHLDAARADVLAFADFPKKILRQRRRSRPRSSDVVPVWLGSAHNVDPLRDRPEPAS